MREKETRVHRSSHGRGGVGTVWLERQVLLLLLRCVAVKREKERGPSAKYF